MRWSWLEDTGNNPNEAVALTKTTTDAMLAAVDRAMLTPLVRSALLSDTLEVVHWKGEQIHGGAGGGAGAGSSAVYRFSGQARNLHVLQPWALILKILRARVGDDPSGSHYWRREAEAYQSRLLDVLPGGLAAPRCFGVTDHPGESCWLWLEDVKDETGPWPLERYGLAARHLGSFNAAFLTDQSAPLWPWLSTEWIRKDLEQVSLQIDRLGTSLTRPLLRRLLPGDAAARVFRLWAEREAFLAALDRLPQTLCHFDAFRRNLFARRVGSQDQTVLIDWAFMGRGALGAEIVSLVWVTLAFWEVDAAQAQQFSEIVFQGYLEGLRDAGWHGAEQQTRLGYAAAIALRRLGTIGYVLLVILDENRHAEVEMLVRRPIGEWCDQFAEAGRFVETLADQARDLMKRPDFKA
jgi:hypothetical protein